MKFWKSKTNDRCNRESDIHMLGCQLFNESLRDNLSFNI
uniref:Uncharacterized protein n=1 Tax=Rhizophora mucronata TaxID=61149 RepID=A0A2P2IH53_RHIMU